MGYLGEPVHDWLTCVVLLDLRRLLIAREPPGPVVSWRREKRTWLAEKTQTLASGSARPGLGGIIGNKGVFWVPNTALKVVHGQSRPQDRMDGKQS